jgi:hypothetical protein
MATPTAPIHRADQESVSVSQLTRLLASLALDFESRRALCLQMRGLVEQLTLAGLIAVSGEQALAAQTEAALQSARQALEVLLDSDSEVQGQHDELVELQEILGATMWDVAEQAVRQLQVKLQRQHGVIRDLNLKIDDWRTRISAITPEVEQARHNKAPVRKEEDEVRRWTDLVEQARGFIQDQQYARAADTLRKLENREGDADLLLELIREKSSRAEVACRQTDVLLLRSGAEEGRFTYTVLLRTASEPGSHGVNIEDSSTLVRQDRDLVFGLVEQVTTAVDERLTRRFHTRLIDDTTILPPPIVADMDGVSRTGNLPPGVDLGSGSDRLGALLQDVGELMYRLFLPESMQRYLLETESSLTITTNDLELPWELMFDGAEFVCLRRPVARMPLGRALPRSDQSRQSPGKLRFLFVHADPDGTLGSARDEVHTIATALRNEWQNEVEVDVVEDATGQDLNERLRRGGYDVIHYAGHAHFDGERGELSGLLLADHEVFFAQKIRRLLKGRPLVFLNACQSGRTANEQEVQRVESYFARPAEGLASAFIYGGALGCIGSIWPIYDQPASLFAIECYNRVLQGYMIGDALRTARELSRATHPDDVTWASFVLYGDPTFTLVR